MNPWANLQGLLGSPQMSGSGLLGGGMGGGSLLGFHPFQPNFGASPFQRAPYQPQRFAAPQIGGQQAPAATAPAQGLSTTPAMGAPMSAQQAAQALAFMMPASYQGMRPDEIAYAMGH